MSFLLNFAFVVYLANAADSHEIYLAIRDDAWPGKGTEQDPFDASTPDRYTTLLEKYQPNYTFHYLPRAGSSPAVFRTRGWFAGKRRTAGAGCKHLGAGMNRTIIQLVEAGNGPSDGVIFGSDGSGDPSVNRADGFELHDVTLDCNASAQPKWTRKRGAFVTGVYTFGSNIMIDRVHVKNFGTRHPQDECFPIFVCAQDVEGTYANNVVQNCRIDSAVRGNLGTCTAIAVGGSAKVHHPVFMNNVARGNVIDLTNSDFVVKAPVYAQIIQGNHIKGCSAGWYTEPAGMAHAVIFRDNVVENCYFAFQGAAHVGGEMEGILVEGNEFVNCGGAQLLSDDSANHYKEVTVRNNKFLKLNSGFGLSGRALLVRSAVKVTIEDNQIDTHFARPIDVTAITVKVSGNHDSRGRSVSFHRVP